MRIAALAVVLMLVAPTSAAAVSIEDLIRLSQAGLGDDVLLAVLDADPTRFDLDAETIIEIRRAGVSERVLLAMLASGRERPTPPDVVSGSPAAVVEDPTYPGLVVIGGRPEPPRRPRPVGFVPVPVFGFTHHLPRRPVAATGESLDTRRGFGRFINDGFRTPRPTTAAPAGPLTGPDRYWGFGGTRRPGSWEPARPADR